MANNNIITDELLAYALAQSMKSPEELKAEELVQKNYEKAIEEIPESLINVNMLYLDVNINGLHFKAFVDTGAQVSIMSEVLAEACNLHHLIDRKYQGVAKGVGQAEIKGRIHCIDVYLGTKVLPCGFTILNTGDLKLIIGLDMLLSHGCVLDMRNRCLVLGEERIEFVKGDL